MQPRTYTPPPHPKPPRSWGRMLRNAASWAGDKVLGITLSVFILDAGVMNVARILSERVVTRGDALWHLATVCGNLAMTVILVRIVYRKYLR